MEENCRPADERTVEEIDGKSGRKKVQASGADL